MSSKGDRLVPVALFAAVVTFHLLTLMRFPAPFVDEAWFAGRAWALIHSGHAFSTLDMGIIEELEGYWTFFPWLPAWIQAQVMSLFASPDIFAVRIVSLAFGLMLLAAVYAIADQLGGRRLALLSVVLVSVSWPFFYSAHLARTDIMAAAFGFMAVALYANHRSSRSWMGLISGLCVGVAYEMHAYGAIFGVAIVALYFLDLRWIMFKSRHFWSFVLGTIVGLVFYAALHILPYPQTYYEINQLTFAVDHIPPILTLDPHVITQAVSDMGVMLFAAYQPMILVILLSIVVLVKRSSEVDKRLLVLAGSLVIGHTLLIRTKFLYYAILVTPALDLIVATFLLQFFQYRWRGRVRDYAYHTFVWGLLAGAIALNLSALRIDFQGDYQLAQSRISEVVKPGDSIMGPQTYWFGLYDHTYYSWEKLRLYQRYEQGSTLQDALQEFRPDILIIDRFLSFFMVEAGQEQDLYQQTLGVPRSEMETFLTCYADLMTEFDGGYYGQVRVYRINWHKKRGIHEQDRDCPEN